MNIYFVYSPSLIKIEPSIVFGIKKLIKELKIREISDFMTDINFGQLNDEQLVASNQTSKKNAKRASVAIFELSKPSTGLGSLVFYRINLGKPTICLYSSGSKIPQFLMGEKSSCLQLLEYSKHNIRQVLKEALKQAAKLQNVRFNLMIPQHLNKALDAEAERQNMSRARFLREIIVEKLSAISQEE